MLGIEGYRDGNFNATGADITLSRIKQEGSETNIHYSFVKKVKLRLQICFALLIIFYFKTKIKIQICLTLNNAFCF